MARGISQVLESPAAWNQVPAMVTILPNGVKVATKQTFGELSSVGLYIDAGVRDECPATAGAATLISKLALSGTAKRSKAKLELEVELMGAELSVEASRQTTSFSLSMPSASVAKGVEILGDMASSPGISNLAKEKEAIIRSLEETDQPTRAVIDDRLHTCAFRDYALGYSGVGPFEGLAGLSEDALKGYVAANYTADRMVLSIVGPGSHAEAVTAATAAFGGFKAGAAAVLATKPYFCGAELIYRNDEMGPTAYVAVGWEGVPWKSPDAVTFMVMQKIIGGYKKGVGIVPGNLSGNRTINNVANKMGVGCADEFEAFSINYKDTGMFGFYAACDEVALEHCIGELMFGINLMSHALTEEEVARAKREVKAALASSSTTQGMCAELGTQVMYYGRSVPAAEMMLRIDAIDSEEVKRVAWKYLNDQDVAVTALGPTHGMPQYLELRRATGMHRY